MLTGGDFVWAAGDIAGDAVPAPLKGAFADEPRWVDLRFARTDEQLDLNNPTFSAAVADIASAIRGIPKDELESEEVIQHRRTVRTAWAAGVGLLVLALLAGATAIYALDRRSEAIANATEADENAAQAEANAAEAERQAARAEQNEQLARSRELAASAINVISDDPQLSILLAFAAIDESPVGVDPPPETVKAMHRAVQSSRMVLSFDGPAEGGSVGIAMSPDGSLLAHSTDGWRLELRDTATGEVVDVFEHVGPGTPPTFANDGSVAVTAAFSPDGLHVATTDTAGSVHLWEVATRTERHLENLGSSFHLTFSPDSRLLAAAVTDFDIGEFRVVVWDII